MCVYVYTYMCVCMCVCMDSPIAGSAQSNVEPLNKNILQYISRIRFTLSFSVAVAWCSCNSGGEVEARDPYIRTQILVTIE